MRSEAKSVSKYLSELPADRRAALEAVRQVILENLDKDYEEGMQCGMLAYYVPHRVFPAGYHCDPRQPLTFAGLASQKNHMAVYLMCVYGNAEHLAWFRKAWAASGKKLDMGKSCVRFKKLEDVALDVIGEAIRRVPARAYVEHYEKLLAAMPRHQGRSRRHRSGVPRALRARGARDRTRTRDGTPSRRCRSRTTGPCGS
jgi:hypothetical protein